MMRVNRRLKVLFLALIIHAVGVASLRAAKQRDARRAGMCITVAKTGRASPTAGIQEALDRLPRDGGTVLIPEGHYVIRCPIRLRDRITLEGAGSNTVLIRPPVVEAKLARPPDRNDRSIVVTDASGFTKGCGIFVFDDAKRSWEGTLARVTHVRGNQLFLDAQLVTLYSLQRHARAATLYPFIDAPEARDVIVRNLVIDGRRHESPGPPLDFVYSGIHFHNVRDGLIENCTLRNQLGDGISVQNGSGTVVRNCLSENNNCNGYHPGTLLRDAVFENNKAFGNGQNGLYFCAGVERTKVVRNEFRGNTHNGIGGLGDYGDRDNLVSENVCAENARSGIEVISGSANKVTRNECVNNSTSAAGRYPGITLTSTTNCIIAGNACLDTQAEPTQWVGIREDKTSERNTIVSNRCPTVRGESIVVQGTRTTCRGNVP
jgi:parallel beta-helix repeat protein